MVLSLFAASPASADGNGNGNGNDITALTSTFPSMHPGETAWVSTLWRGADKDATNFQMTATSSDATTIGYPENTGKFSSLWGSSTLQGEATDFAALKLTVDPTATVTITLHVSYDLRQDGGNSKTKAKTQTIAVKLPVSVVGGAAITAVTTSLGPVAAGSTTWQKFSVHGEKPGVTSLTAQVSGPAGITFAYPGGNASTSPSQLSTLDVGVTDYFAFQVVVAKSVTKGSYNLTVTMTYGNGSQMTAVVPLSVT
jgi:hypothetical protein